MFQGARGRSPPRFPTMAELGGVRWNALAPLSNVVTPGPHDPTWKGSMEAVGVSMR